MKRLLSSRKVLPSIQQLPHSQLVSLSAAKEEHHLSLVLNSKARRGSFTSHAFPELHHKKVRVMLTTETHNVSSCQKEPEPDHLLLVTRTRTDARGRRHSVAVPVLPPPDGEKFAGGYQIQRNPITGGARLLPPPAPGQQLSIL